MRIFSKLIIIALALFCCTSMMAQEHSTYKPLKNGNIQFEVRCGIDDLRLDQKIILKTPLAPVYNVVFGIGYRINDYNYVGINVGNSEIFGVERDNHRIAPTPIYANYVHYFRTDFYENRNSIYIGSKAGVLLNYYASHTGGEIHTLYLKITGGINLPITKFMSFDAELNFGVIGFGASAGLVFDI